MRVQGGIEALLSFVESRRTTPFGWGAHDCCLFAADAAAAICGVDYAAPVRGYTTREAAEEIIAEYGGMEAMVSALVGREPTAPSMARRGDLVLAVLEGRETMGVCVGAQCAFAQLGAGVLLLPRSVGVKAWRVS